MKCFTKVSPNSYTFRMNGETMYISFLESSEVEVKTNTRAIYCNLSPFISYLLHIPYDIRNSDSVITMTNRIYTTLINQIALTIFKLDLYDDAFFENVPSFYDDKYQKDIKRDIRAALKDYVISQRIACTKNSFVEKFKAITNDTVVSQEIKLFDNRISCFVLPLDGDFWNDTIENLVVVRSDAHNNIDEVYKLFKDSLRYEPEKYPYIDKSGHKSQQVSFIKSIMDVPYI